ncbi:MAG: hypothetical protein AB7F50_12135 [Fimbriimonadaceae bacterium]
MDAVHRQSSGEEALDVKPSNEQVVRGLWLSPDCKLYMGGPSPAVPPDNKLSMDIDKHRTDMVRS